jgi:hypothetical protein
MGSSMTYLIHYVDEGLSVVPAQTPNDIGYLPAREGRHNEGCEFNVGDAADQTSQGLFTRVENKG